MHIVILYISNDIIIVKIIMMIINRLKDFLKDVFEGSKIWF